MRCETVGARVLGLVCDAGGSNARLYKLLAGHQSLPEGGWLHVDYVQVKNPWDIERVICLFYCSTHDLKAMRNALLVSWFSSGKKMFFSTDDVKISYQVLVDCYGRDEQRVAKSGSPLTRLNEAAIKPDKWSKMSVTNTIKVFEHRTLAEISMYLYAMLDVSLKDQLQADQFKVKINGRKHMVLGFWPSVGKHLHSLMKKSSKNLPDFTKSAIV